MGWRYGQAGPPLAGTDQTAEALRKAFVLVDAEAASGAGAKAKAYENPHVGRPWRTDAFSTNCEATSGFSPPIERLMRTNYVF